MTTLVEGATHTHERQFTDADVRQFADVTGDQQARHTEPDDGRLLVHGLLTGSLLTKIGGDLDVLATQMTFQFRRPVYTGDTVVCEWTNERVADHPEGQTVEASVVCRRRTDETESEEEVVLKATVEGVVYE